PKIPWAIELAQDNVAHDVKRFVTPLSYRENDEVLTCSKSAARMARSQVCPQVAQVYSDAPSPVIAEITPLELCRQSDAQRRASIIPSVFREVLQVSKRYQEKVQSPKWPSRGKGEKRGRQIGGVHSHGLSSQSRETERQRCTTHRSEDESNGGAARVTVPDLAATVTSPRGAFTVAVPIGSARSSSPTLQCPQRAATDWSVTVPVASLTTPPTATVVTDKASSVLQRGVSHLPRRTFTQSCSVPSLLSPSPEPVPSLAQIVIQQLNTPSRQARNSIACPLTARLPTRPANVQTAPRPAVSTPSTPRPANLADFKPLLTELFDDKIDKEAEQSAQQLQHKIDQLQKLQQILQMQQEGLKQQQKAQSYQPKASKITRMEPPARGYSAASPRGPEVPFSTSPRARSSQAGRRRFMV
ncbi:unnamed protein product, partial [Cladocopium goreaui]